MKIDFFTIPVINLHKSKMGRERSIQKKTLISTFQFKTKKS